MNKRLNCFIPAADLGQVESTVKALKESELVKQVYLLATEEHDFSSLNCPVIKVDSLTSSKTVESIAKHADADYSLIYTKYTSLELGFFALERFLFLADSSNAAMVYADNYQAIEGKRSSSPLIAYQEGSL